MSDPIRLDGSVACVTGAGGGIGAAVARVLAARGARVALVDAAAAPIADLVDELGPDVSFSLVGDVTDESDMESAFERTLAEFGSCTILVNAAGLASKYPFPELPLAEWRRMIDVQLTGTFLACRAAVAPMTRSGGGAIVNVTSIAAEGANPLAAHYAAAKGGVKMLTRAAAVALAPQGIRVNAVGPGLVETPLTAARLSDAEARAASLRRIPMGRFAKPTEIAQAVAFLASPAASYITGASLYVDGGWTSALYDVDFAGLVLAMPEDSR